MQIHAILETRKAAILKELETLQAELNEIDRMLDGTPRAATTSTEKTPATKDEAIIRAIEAGNRTPAQISDFMRQKLGIAVNDASTRTRLSRMKSADKLDHDGSGWKLKD